MSQPITFLSPIDMNGLGAKNLAVESLGSDPGSPGNGQFYRRTTDGDLMYFNGTSWLNISGDIKSLADAGSSRLTVVNGSGGDATIDVNVGNLINDAASTSSTLWSATKILSEIDASKAGLNTKEKVVAASTASLTLATDVENGSVMDGVTLNTNDRILLMHQTDASENGIHIVQASGAPARASDLADTVDAANVYCFVQKGTENADLGFVCTSDSGSAVVGTDDLVFTQFTSSGAVVAGDALSKSGLTLDVKYDDSSIALNGSNQLVVKASGVTNDMLAGSIADSKLSAIATANKVSGSAVQLGTNGSLEDDSGLKVKFDNSTVAVNGSNQLSVKAGGVGSTQLAADAVNGDKIADAAVDSEHYVDGSIDTAHLADAAVTKAKTTGLVGMYPADFVDTEGTDWDSGVLTVPATTHGLGETKNLIAMIYKDGSPNVAQFASVSVSDGGEVKFHSSINFAGHYVIMG